MIILPEHTVRTWGEAITARDWLRISHALVANSLGAFIAGKFEVADDWRMLSDLALQHSQDAEEEIERVAA